MTTTQELMIKAEEALDELSRKHGEVVGVRDLLVERTRVRHSVQMAIAAMSIITIVAVLVTVALLRQPGPPGPSAPTPLSAQFVRDDAGCLYRVLYRTHDGAIVPVDARAPRGACNG